MITSGDLGEWGNELHDREVSACKASGVEIFFSDFIEDTGVYDELPAEGAVEFGVIWPIICSSHLLDISSGIFVGQDESVLDVLARSCLSFFFDEGGI